MPQTAVFDVRLGRQGRLVIPARLRRALGVASGDTLVARVEGGARLVLEKRQAARSRLQARFEAIPRSVSLVDDLLSDRRMAARREAGR